MPCLSDYLISSPSFPSHTGPVFLDTSKTKRVAIISPAGHSAPPCSDAVVLYQKSSDECNITWYECPSIMGRTYTIVATGCDVVVTSFDGGFHRVNHCDAQDYGSYRFCFGKVYSSSANQVMSHHDECSTIFEFDGHTFSVVGQKSVDSEIYDCSACQETITPFGGPPVPGDFGGDDTSGSDSDSDSNTIVGETVVLDSESRTFWDFPPRSDESLNDTTDATDGVDVSGDIEIPVASRTPCESQNRPSCVVLPDGHAIIAYEQRDELGQNQISLAALETSVREKIIYYRSESRGTLLNNADLVYHNGEFEVFDDLVIATTNNVPVTPIFIGFLSGPLRGGRPFSISTITRSTDDDTGRIKYTIKFGTNDREVNFANSNNQSDILWFISTGAQETLPDIALLTLTPHLDSDEKPCPVANPSICALKNQLATGRDQYIYLVYQAFVSKRWNIYFRQIRLSDIDAQAPRYLAPYTFSQPVLTLNPISLDTLTYRLVDINSTPGTICALFEASTSDNQPIYRCTNTTPFVTACNFSISDNKVYVEAVFSITLCPQLQPNWVIGQEYTGPVPPTASDLGWTGNTACMTGITPYPAVSGWCYYTAECSQYYLVDDPYCPFPYADQVQLSYFPEDLWVIRDGDTHITRVKYHMSIASADSDDDNAVRDAVDLMFVVDFSGSMNETIAGIRQNIILLADIFQQSGVDIRFGLTIFGKQETAEAPDSAKICTGDCGGQTLLYNGLWNVTSDNGFTNDASALISALSVDADGSTPENGYSAILFALNSPDIVWRDYAKKYIMLITDTTDDMGDSSCEGFENDAVAAAQAISDNSASIILAIKQSGSSGQCSGNGNGYIASLSDSSEEEFDVFDFNGSYTEIFQSISQQIITKSDRPRVLERSIAGYDPTFIRNAEIFVTYSGDLSDKWTSSKHEFKFTDVIPIANGNTKGLSAFPFSIQEVSVFGVDTVHYKSDITKWVYFSSGGQITIDHPSVGYLDSKITDPILVSQNSINPKVKCNNRNDVFVVYESIEHAVSQIHIKGTGDFCQNSITGPKSTRQFGLLELSNFIYHHEITTDGEGINQLPDFCIDSSDIIHVTWQSNRDKYWEIYYANSENIFDNTVVTKLKHRSGYPAIEVDVTGNTYIVYHSNTFGTYDIFMSIRESERTIPLLEQDAYMASLRSGFKHYTNNLPVFLANPISTQPLPGRLFATKIASEPGNGNENFIFGINEDGTLFNTNAIDYEIIALAGTTSGALFGVTVDHKLLEIDEFEQNSELSVEASEIREVGTIDVPVPDPETIVFLETFSGTSGVALDESRWLRLTSQNGIYCAATFRPCSVCPAISGQCATDRTVAYLSRTTTAVNQVVSVSADVGVPSVTFGGDASAAGVDIRFILRADPATATGLPVFPKPSYSLMLKQNPITTPLVFTEILDALNYTALEWVQSGSLVIAADSIHPPAFGGDQILQLIYKTPTQTANQIVTVRASPVLVSSPGFFIWQISLILHLDSDVSEARRNVITLEVKWPTGTNYGVDWAQLSLGTLDGTGSSPTTSLFVTTALRDLMAAALIPLSLQGYNNYKAVCTNGETSSRNIAFYINDILIHTFTEPYIAQPLGHYAGFILRTNAPGSGVNARMSANLFTLEDGDSNVITTDVELIRHELTTDRTIVTTSFQGATTETPTNYRIICETVDSSVHIEMFRDSVKIIEIDDENMSGSGPIINNTSSAFAYGFYEQTSVTTMYFVFIDNFKISIPPATAAMSKITDASFDTNNRLWMLVCDVSDLGNTSMKIIQVDTSNASTVREEDIIDNIDKLVGGLTTLNTGDFYITVFKDGRTQLMRSDYPIITLNEVSFNFTEVDGNFTNIVAMTSDENDILYGITENNIVYIINIGGDDELLYDLTSFDPYVDDPYTPEPISKVSGFAYHYTGQQQIIGESGFFHVLLEFYDNINLEGTPAVLVDSQNNLEAFLPINEDEYSGVQGVYLNSGDSAIVNFNAAHFRPGASRLSYPYSFHTNQTYFVKASLVSPTGLITPVSYIQKTSFSCNKCTRLGDNIFDSHGCSLSFTLSNKTTEKPLRLSILVYGDQEKTLLIRQYFCYSGHADLAFMEINNSPASEHSFIIGSGEYLFIQLYPHLDSQSGLLCGIDYYVEIYECSNSNCSEIENITSLVDLQTQTFRCECSSNIFEDKIVALSQISRWKSSAYGYSDTRITDSPQNTMRPKVSRRSSGGLIIFFEDYTSSPAIKASTFFKSNIDDLFGSGMRGKFDFDFNTEGKTLDIDIDHYDRIVATYERTDPIAGHGVSKEEIRNDAIYSKLCDFEPPVAGITTETKCDISAISTNIVTSDPIIAKDIVRKILITPTDYYTINSSGESVSVVSVCNLTLKIWGTPECVAVRIRNDNDEFTEWCPFRPEISDYYMEKAWTLSKKSGVKEICIQAMTYSGLTSQFCIPVIADYSPISYEVKLYKSKEYDEVLPKFDELFVASTSFDEDGKPRTEISVFVEIIPSTNIENDNISYDVIQQGTNDLTGLPASSLDEGGNRIFDRDGRIVFRGSFVIKRDDKAFNVDGLARIVANFPELCDIKPGSDPPKDVFSPNFYNTLTVQDSPEDVLEQSRQSSGQIGVTMNIRPGDDPYLIFGDPNIYLKKSMD